MLYKVENFYPFKNRIKNSELSVILDDYLNDNKFIERLIKISRVTKVTKGGKKLSFRAVVVIGDENGQVGVGVGKAEDVVNAFKKAKTDGRKNLIKWRTCNWSLKQLSSRMASWPVS